MTRFESLFVLIILVVISMYTVVHVHNRFSAETGSVNSFQSNQMQDLNNTLFALNVELKKMLRDAERLENEANSALAQLRGQTGGPPETEKAIAPAESSQSFRPEPREIISRGKKAVIFTMDSISQYEENSKHGGAAGELLVRYCLQEALVELGTSINVVKSDSAFNSIDGSEYDYIILDPWTWAAKGWVPKQNIREYLDKVYILDFFGTKELRQSLKIPLSRILTPFGTPWNTFLGFYVKEAEVVQGIVKKKQGVIWGKDPKHFTGQKDMLGYVSSRVPLMSTSQSKVFAMEGITWLGHQTPESWKTLLAESKFVLGLGDPLLGPSAIDAVAAGCMYINPVYEKPVRDIYKSQHDFAASEIGFPHVCSVKLSDRDGLMKCIDYALKNEIKPYVPDILSRKAYLERVESIFQ